MSHQSYTALKSGATCSNDSAVCYGNKRYLCASGLMREVRQVTDFKKETDQKVKDRIDIYVVF
uniref:Uncharacterized protein n=1 Tax=Arion vulgaris TaxID=1028688 RepID=A0A0B6ZTV3_9EUPU